MRHWDAELLRCQYCSSRVPVWSVSTRSTNATLMWCKTQEEMHCYPVDLQRLGKRSNAFFTDVVYAEIQRRQCLERVEDMNRSWTQGVLLVWPDWSSRHHWETGHLQLMLCSIEDPTSLVSIRDGNGEERIEWMIVVILYCWCSMHRQEIEFFSDSYHFSANSVF